MVTDFGDIYDHFKDMFINFTMLILIFKKYYNVDSNNICRYLPFLIIPLYISMGIY